MTAQKALARLAAEADETGCATERFVAMLSHELRNPLMRIVTSLELLRMHGQDDSEQAILERQVQHLIRLVDDLADMSRIKCGSVELKKRPIAVAEIVAASADMVSPLLRERGHRLVVEVPPQLVVKADPDRMTQVVSNLLTNARSTAIRGP